jgi:zinc transporter ZupT
MESLCMGNLPGEPYCSCFRGFCSYFHTNFTLCFGFAAGAMIFVVVEVIPETQQDNNTDIATMGLLGIYCYDGLGCCSWLELWIRITNERKRSFTF